MSEPTSSVLYDMAIAIGDPPPGLPRSDLDIYTEDGLLNLHINGVPVLVHEGGVDIEGLGTCNDIPTVTVRLMPTRITVHSPNAIHDQA